MNKEILIIKKRNTLNILDFQLLTGLHAKEFWCLVKFIRSVLIIIIEILWETVAITSDIDKNEDWNPDETFYLENQLRMLYLPVIWH